MNVKLPLGSIVVGVDGSSQSMDAVSWAAGQADRERRPLVIANATGVSTLGGTVDTPQNRQIRRMNGRRHVDRALTVATKAAPTLRVETIIRATSAKLLLLGLAENAHLVVVGSRGLGPIGSVALRSVSVAVASGSSAPVVVVRTSGDTLQGEHIVVGADGTEASAEALEFAFAQASERGAPLTVVHCSSDPVLGMPSHDRAEDEVDYREDQQVLLAESVAGLREKYVDVHASFEIAPGPAVSHLVEASRNASLVVVGARGHHGPGASFLGSVSQNVVERAHCSVAVVHRRTEVP